MPGLVHTAHRRLNADRAKTFPTAEKPDLYSSPHDQFQELLRLTIEAIKEHQEGELINSPHYGLIANCAPYQRIPTLAGPPTPDDLET